MTFVDDQGRLFGRWNIVDALIGVVLIGLIPLLYGAYVLFKPSRPSLTAIEPARILSGTDLDLKVRGTNLRPYMRVSVGTHQGNRFLFVDETEAVVPMNALPPGVYDVILYDHAQEQARISKGFEVVATPRPEAELDVIGSFTGLADHLAASITQGTTVDGVGQITQVGSRVPSLTRATLGPSLILDVPSDGVFNVPAIVRAKCALVPRSGSVWCMAGDLPLMEDTVLRLALPGGSMMFQVDQLRLVGPTEPITVRVRFAGDRAALELMRSGDRDVRRQNEFAAGASIASLGGLRQASTSVGVVIPVSPSVMSAFVATDLAFRDAVLRVPAQRLGNEWSYAGRTLRAGAVTTFYGPNYELRATILSVEAAATTRP